MNSVPIRRILPLAALFLITMLLFGWGWWRATAVGPQVQVPMFYDDHYVYPRAWTQAQEVPGVPEPAPIAALYGSNRLTQLFVGPSSGLVLLELWLAGPVGIPVELSLMADDGSVYGGMVSLEAGDGRYYRFVLPQPASAQNFTLTLAAPQATAEQPVITRAVGGDRLGSSLRLNEYRQPGNLELYTYERGWFNSLREQLLPTVFQRRIQQYKPAFFKGAAFPFLLLATALATAVFFFLSMPVSRSKESYLRWTGGLWLAFLIWQVGSGRVLLPIFTRAIPLPPQTTALAIAPMPDAQFRLVQSFSQTLWTAVRHPEPRFVTTDMIDNLPAVVVPANSALEYALNMPVDGQLRLGMKVQASQRLRFTVRWGEQILHSQVVSQLDGLQWLWLDLTAWAGQSGSLILQTEPVDGLPTGAWLMPQLLTDSSWLLTETDLGERPFLPTSVSFDDTVVLLGYRTEQSGEQLSVTLYWQALRLTDNYATVFVHLLDESGNIVAQHDSPPVNGTYPVSLWQTETIIVDQHQLPGVAVNGPYQLAVGLYDPATLTRWPVKAENGELLPDGRVLLKVMP